MSPSFTTGIVLILAGGLVAALNPLAQIGNGIRPGLGDVLNGGSALVLLLAGALTLLVGWLRGRRAPPR